MAEQPVAEWQRVEGWSVRGAPLHVHRRHSERLAKTCYILYTVYYILYAIYYILYIIHYIQALERLGKTRRGVERRSVRACGGEGGSRRSRPTSASAVVPGAMTAAGAMDKPLAGRASVSNSTATEQHALRAGAAAAAQTKPTISVSVRSRPKACDGHASTDTSAKRPWLQRAELLGVECADGAAAAAAATAALTMAARAHSLNL